MYMVLLAAAAAAFPFPIQEKTLPNGLHLYAVKFDSPGLIAYYTVVRTGSRNEVEPGKSGFAHFFEHMMFRGTDKYPAEKFNAVLKSLGADSNAYTSDDLTVYHELAGKEALPTLIEIESDRFQHLKYDEAAFQKESRAVLGEYNKSASDPMWKLEETIDDNAYTTHTYKHTTIGFLKDIEDMPNQYQHSKHFYDLWYRPDNVAVIVVGDFDADEFFKLAAEKYGDWKKTTSQRPTIPTEPPQTKEKRVALTWPGPTLPMLYEGWHTPAFSTNNIDVPALDVLEQLLFAERAPLYKKLVITEQKVVSIDGGASPHRDPNLFSVLARVKKADDLGYVEKAVDDEIARIGKEGVDAKTLDEVLSHLRYNFAASLSNADRVANIAARYYALGGSIQTINDYYALLGKVTAKDVQRVAQKYFKPTGKTVVTLKGGAK